MIIPQIEQLGGVNSAVSPLIQPTNSPTILNGVDPTFKLGALTKDAGYAKVGDTLEADKSVTGLFNFRQTAAIEKVLATINNSAGTNLTLKYNNAGTWTDIALGGAWDGYEDCKVEMEQFIGYCFMLGYDATDNVFLPVASLVGTTFSTVTNVTDMPQGKYLVRYRDRLYVINSYYGGTAYPFRAYYSSVPSAGAITWTPAANDFIDTGDYGEELMGGAENWDRLMLFTRYRAIMYDQSQKKGVWATGCSSHRSIITHGAYMGWANSDGYWLSTGGQPVNIAGPVIDAFRTGNPDNFIAKVVDESIKLYVGIVIIDEITYTNCLMTYHIPTNMWWWRELKDEITALARVKSSGTQRLYMGDTDGMVHDKGKHTDATQKNDDNGSPIPSNFELAPIYLGTLSLEKEVAKLVAYAKRAGGLKLKARVIDKNSRKLTEYMELGELTGYVNEFEVDVGKGTLIQIAGYEYGKSPYWMYYGHELEVNLYSEILEE